MQGKPQKTKGEQPAPVKRSQAKNFGLTEKLGADGKNKGGSHEQNGRWELFHVSWEQTTFSSWDQKTPVTIRRVW